MNNFYKQGITFSLLIGLVLESCYTPSINTSKKVPLPQPAAYSNNLGTRPANDYSEPLSSAILPNADLQLTDDPGLVYIDNALRLDDLAPAQPIDSIGNEKESLQIPKPGLFTLPIDSQDPEA